MPDKDTFSQKLAQTILRMIGWTWNFDVPPEKKYVVVGAPHTTNWDFLLTLLIRYGAGIRLNWIGKQSIFRWPFGWLFRKLGGIPVNRHTTKNFVQQIVDEFARRDSLIIAITPEGTRSKAPYWKSGFYYIAQGAGVPIAMCYVDFQMKEIGLVPGFIPSGDIDADFVHIREFFKDKVGKFPHKQGEIRLRPKDGD